VTNLARHLRIHLLLGTLVVLPAPAVAQSEPGQSKPAPQQRDGQHDFDFEFGEWTIRLSRLERPLSGSTTWVDYEGTSVVRRVWNGRANLGELDVTGPAGRIAGLSLRLYNPQSRQWNISWANSSNGTLGPPMVGEFRNGRGEFFNQELLNGRAIYVRFVFSDITPRSFRFEQAFSDDGGKTWETNWKATFTKVSDDKPGRF
jgi:hypothetical protein